MEGALSVAAPYKGSFRPEADIHQGSILRFGGAYKAGGGSLVADLGFSVV